MKSETLLTEANGSTSSSASTKPKASKWAAITRDQLKPKVKPNKPQNTILKQNNSENRNMKPPQFIEDNTKKIRQMILGSKMAQENVIKKVVDKDVSHRTKDKEDNDRTTARNNCTGDARKRLDGQFKVNQFEGDSTKVKLGKDEETRKMVPAKDIPSRRVSFKVTHRNSSTTRRGKLLESRVTLTSSKVAELASKFNSLICENDASKGPVVEGSKVLVIPQGLARKSGDIKLIKVSRKGNSVRKDNGCSGGKCGNGEDKSGCHKVPAHRNKRSSNGFKPGFSIGNVKAAIQIFEQNSSLTETGSPARCKPIPEDPVQTPPKRLEPSPKYSKVVFKRNSTLVLLDCESIDETPAPETVTQDVPKPGVGMNSQNIESPPEIEVKLPSAKAANPGSAGNEVNEDSGPKTESGNCDVADKIICMESEDDANVVPPMKPNSSFLWGTRPGLEAEQEKYRAVPILLSTKEDNSIATESPPNPSDAYDDVYPPSTDYSPESIHSYSSLEDDAVYDDVGAPTGKSKGTPEVSENGYDYCGNGYDDCVGVGYQSIEDDVETESNIYDDVLKASETISNCYESIYSGGSGERVIGGLGGSELNGRGGGQSSVASSSLGSELPSSCDQSNSLYGVGGSRFDSTSVSQASTVSADDGRHEVLSYQLTSVGQPRSETSDEWVDMEMSGSDGETDTFVVVKGHPRGRRSPSWSRKVRRCSKAPRKHASNRHQRDQSSDSDTDHHYEMLYEVVNNNNNNNADLIPCCDSDSSFDSDVSESTYIKPQVEYQGGNGRLPELPSGQQIYGITRIAEAAGKKMIQLGRTLRKIRTRRSNTVSHITTTLPPELPARRPTLPLSPPPPLPPPPAEKAPAFGGSVSRRRNWFRRSVSSVSQNTSTFYLTPAVDVDTGLAESAPRRGSEVCSENGESPTTPSSVGSTKTLVEVLERPAEVSVPAAKAARPQERRSSGYARPNSPPPLPPVAPDIPKRPTRKDKKTTTSWYAEVGLFDRLEQPTPDIPKRPPSKQDRRASSNSWYAEVGLWSNRRDSSASEQETSQSTEASDSSNGRGSNTERRFASEPLYQFYTASVAELAQQQDTRADTDSDGYEEIGNHSVQSRPSAMELVSPRRGQQRTLWCEIPEVVKSMVLSTISSHQRKLQEAKFEIITSEASYANSLQVLERHFILSQELLDEAVLSKNDRRTLFSNVLPVKSCSLQFLADLEECWQDNILLTGICEVIYRHATDYFGSYVKYCSNQIYLDRTLRRLKEQHGRFSDSLSLLECSPKCQLLPLHSFLMLPMQRITRLPLLMDAVLTRLDPQDEEYSACQLALATLNKIVQDCNEGARQMERMEEILILSRQLDFPREVRPVPIISSSRWLVRHGELTQLVWRGDEAKLTFGRKFSKLNLHVFLFTDLLIITRKKGDDSFMVVDYCPRNMVQMSSTDGLSNLPVKFSSDGGKHLMLLTMLHNHEHKTVEMMLSCSLESDRQRWLEAVTPPRSANPDETVYEQWDCPQVTAVHTYTARQPDELSLDVSDVVNVLTKMVDGWYQGERIRDGERGWFPGNHTVEIASTHVRAKNLKQRYRLLCLSGNYLDSQNKAK